MALLEIEKLTKRFGGVVANREVSFKIREGEIMGLIGPNGAGKTTLFDVITGYHRPDSGRVLFEGLAILGLRTDQISRAGIARTFQVLRPFYRMTVLENVMVGALPRSATIEEAKEKACELIELVGIADKCHDLARVLSTGQRKRLEMARAMATEPKLLLLDEITGGVDQKSIPGLLEVIQRLRAEGVTLLVIEHNMRMIMSLSDRVLFLHLGEKLAEGLPQEVSRHPDVVKLYLGEGHHA
jgi:branched-chain amino acid transport system ATP-binding protein